MNDSQHQTAAAATAASWYPAIDIVERADSFELQADLPGVSPDDIEISLDGKLLMLSGERSYAGFDASRRHGERRMGRFSRQFTLPDVIDGEAIEAHSSHGTLRLRLPKVARAQARRISISHG